jgi:3alpha(or 20beta)-hydroxysteroid dehydrogenase
MLQDRKLSGKVAIITGGARGMGASHVRAFAECGACVVFSDVLKIEGAELENELGAEQVRFMEHDVTSQADWRRVIAMAEDCFGAISVLVNNAGIVAQGSIEEMAQSEYQRVIDVNQLGTFLGMQAVIRSMRRAGGGSIINISSVAGFAGTPLLAAYVASKFAIRGLTKVGALEFAKDKVRVNSVHPGAIATPMTAAAGTPTEIPIPRFAEPEEVSKLILYLASDDSSYCTGGEFVIDGGFLTLVGQNTL